MNETLNGSNLVSRQVMQTNLRFNRERFKNFDEGLKLPSIRGAFEGTQTSLVSTTTSPRAALDVIDLADPEFLQQMHRMMASKRSQHRNQGSTIIE